MRWKSKPYKCIKLLDSKRIVKRFAIFPILISGEYRWLETVYIKQIYRYDFERMFEFYWENEQFVTKQDYENYVDMWKGIRND